MVHLTRFALSFAVLSAVGTQIASAQSVISAKSGLIHYTEGSVFLNDQLVEPKYGEFPQFKENQQLRTEDGRVEVLLTPGVFLRLGENGAVRMVTNRLINTRLELLSGETLVQVDELLDGNSVVVAYQDYAVKFLKKGIYRLTSEPQELRVYSGEALVILNGEIKILKEGEALKMDGNLRLAKFDKNDVDDLYRWSRRRSEYIAMANVSAASAMQNSGMYGGNVWYWNPYFDMYTFIPFGGMFWDPWGFAFWSPYTIGGYLNSWPGYYPVSGGGGGSGSKPVPHHPPTRVKPTPAPGHGNQPGVTRGVTLAAEAHRAVGTTAGGHAGASFAGSGHSGGSSFSGGGSSGGSGGGSAGSSGHASSGGSSAGSAGGGGGGGGGSHK